MPRFRFQARHLYLLALFQLVGGPLMVLSVIGFSKIVVQHVHEEGLKQGVSSALHSSEWQEVVEKVVRTDSSTQQSKDGKDALKPGEAKAKLVAVPWAGLEFAASQKIPDIPPFCRWQVFLPEWSHAPPVPPPRLMVM